MSTWADILQSRGDCWATAHAVLDRLGVRVPANQAEALASEHALGVELQPNEAAAAGHLVVMTNADGNPHVGVMIDDARMIHAIQNVPRIDRLAVWQRAGRVVRIVKARQA